MMGFDRDTCEKALSDANDSVEIALEKLVQVKEYIEEREGKEEKYEG
jgi:hypothetical protein